MLAEILSKFIYNICKVIVDKRKALDTLNLAVKKDAAPMQNRLGEKVINSKLVVRNWLWW